jgi:hypothetical protein
MKICDYCGRETVGNYPCPLLDKPLKNKPNAPVPNKKSDDIK